MDQLFPEWRMWEQYVSGRMSSALRLDALKNTHSIEVEVKHPGEISEIFDEVSYAKGSAVIRMLAEYLGERDFRNGLRHYLKKHAYQNTRTEDLWAALQKASGKPVKKMMASWTGQPGYPLVTLSKKKNKLSLKQGRFFSSRLSRLAAKNSVQWWQVPVSISGQRILLGKSPLNLGKASKIGKLNLGETALMRTIYPKEMAYSLGVMVKNKRLGAIDRLGLIRDAFALAESGQLPTIQALEFAWAYQNEDSLVVWEELADGLARLRSLLYGTPTLDNYLEFCRKLYEKIGKKLGWKEAKRETHERQMLRSLVLSQLGASGDSEVLDRAKQLLKTKKALPPNLRSVVYGLSARAGGKAEFGLLKQKYLKAASHEEQDRLGRALAQFQDPALIARVLEFALSSHVRAQDAPFILAASLQNPAARNQAWSFITANWHLLTKRYGDGLGLLGRLLKAAGVFASREKYAELEKFFQKQHLPGAKRTAQQVLEKIASNADWLAREEKPLGQWLSAHKYAK